MSDAAEKKKDAIVKYQRLREEVDDLYAKLGQVESDRNEHDLVIESLRELEGERRCWHQVGVVLAEKKVSEIVPILNLNRDHFIEMVKQLTEAVEVKQKEIGVLQAKFGIAVKRS